VAIRIMDPDPDHGSGCGSESRHCKMCLGGGTHCPIASSVFAYLLAAITGWIVMKFGATDHRRVG